MRTAVSGLELLQPRTLRDALRMLRDEGPLTPLAGATDLYVAVNFGTLDSNRFINLWGLDPLRRITQPVQPGPVEPRAAEACVERSVCG